MLSGVALVVILSVDVGWTVNYSFFTAAGIDRKAPSWSGDILDGEGGEGKLPLLRASFFVLHTDSLLWRRFR